MKQMKLMAAMLLALVLVITACSGGNKGTNTPTASNSGGDTPTATVTPEPSEEVAKIDLGGRTIRIAAWWDEKPKGETPSEIARLAKMEELEKEYNFTFEFINIPFDQYMDTFTTSVLSGEPFADVAIMEFKRAVVPVKAGQVLPLSEFTTPASDINNEGKLVNKLPPLAGGEYAFNSPSVSVIGVHYNRDLFERLGLPDLQDLYDNGEWTWEKFMEIAKDATRDTDNDGTNDSWGYASWPADAARHFAAANGVAFVDPDQLVDASNDPKMIEALEFVSRLYNVENVVKVSTGNKMDWNEMMTFKEGDVAMSINYDWNVGDLSFNVGVVPVPKGPSNLNGNTTFAAAALNGWFIPKGVEDPQTVYHIFEQMRNVPENETEDYLGQDWLEGRYKTERDIQFALDHINGTGMIAVEEGVPNYPFYTIMDEIIIQNLSVTATLEAHKQTAVDAVTQLVN